MPMRQSRELFGQRAFRRLTTVIAVAAFAAFAFQGLAAAATTVVVTQNTTTWTQDDTRVGGTVSWSDAYDAPAGLGQSALRLTTDNDNASKAGLYTHTMAGMPLSQVTNLSYWTYQQAANTPDGDASFQLQIDACGAQGGFTTLVYEPYWNGTVAPQTWQQWDMSSGLFWSSKSVAASQCGDGSLVAGAGGPPLYTLAQIEASYPDAVVVGIGANVGTYNPGYDIAVDGIQFNDTTYNFEIGAPPSSKDQCKDGGWMTYKDPSSPSTQLFPNQGQCIQFVNTGK